MQPSRPSYNSFRKKVIKKNREMLVQSKIQMGEVIIPQGSEEIDIVLPLTQNTATYEIVNVDKMTGDISVYANSGQLIGLVMNTSEGNLRINKVEQGTRSTKILSNIKDGSYLNLLSDGSNWFMWATIIGGNLSFGNLTKPEVETGGPFGNSGQSGGSGTIGEPQTEPVVTYEALVVNLEATTYYPGLDPMHTLHFSGTAEPNSIIIISGQEDETITVGADGSWSWDAIDVPNGEFSYNFSSFVDNLQIGDTQTEIFASNDGVIVFTTPDAFEIERGETSPDFTIGVEVLDPNGVSIVPTIVSTYLDTMEHNDTFTVTYSFTYNTVDFERIVNGTVKDNIAPDAPTIDSDSKAEKILTVNGTAEANSNVVIYNGPIEFASTTADEFGQWSISKDMGNSTSTLYLKAQASDAASNYSELSELYQIEFETPILDVPVITQINSLTSGDWSNIKDSITIEGTGPIGAAITLSGFTNSYQFTVDSNGDWSGTISLPDEQHLNILATASLNSLVSQQSAPFVIHVDTVSPVYPTPEDSLFYLGATISDSIPTTATDFSSVTYTSSYNPELANEEGTYVATYTATDLAGNSTSVNRNIVVSTSVEVPLIVSVEDINGPIDEGGTSETNSVTFTGTVGSDYPDNLTINVYDSLGVLEDSGIVIGTDGTWTWTAVGLPSGNNSFYFTTENSVGDESAKSTTFSFETIITFGDYFAEELQAASDNIVGATIDTTDPENPYFVRTNSTGYTKVKWSDFVSYVGDTPQGTDKVTLSFWLDLDNIESTSGQYRSLLGGQSIIGGLKQGFRFANRMNDVGNGTGDYRLAVFLPNGAGEQDSGYVQISPAVTTLWGYHYCVVIETPSGGQRTLKIYQNGSLIIQKNDWIDSTTPIIPHDANAEFGIGAAIIDGTLSTTAFQVKIDSVQIKTGVAIGSTEIAQIFADKTRQTKIVDTLTTQVTSITDNRNSTTYNDGDSLWIPTGSNIEDILTITTSRTPTTITWPVIDTSQTSISTEYTFTVEDEYGYPTSFTLFVEVVEIVQNGIEDLTTFTTYDSAATPGSTNAYLDSLGFLNVKAGGYLQSNDFNDYQIGNGNITPTSKTLSAWFYMDSVRTDFDNNNTLMAKWNTTTNQRGYILSMGFGNPSYTGNIFDHLRNNSYGSGHIRFIGNNRQTGMNVDQSSFFKFERGVTIKTWHHVIFQINNIVDGSQTTAPSPDCRVFIDGVLLQSSVRSSGSGTTLVNPINGWLNTRAYIDQHTEEPLRIGKNVPSSTAQYFDGRIDAVNIDGGFTADAADVRSLFLSQCENYGWVLFNTAGINFVNGATNIDDVTAEILKDQSQRIEIPFDQRWQRQAGKDFRVSFEIASYWSTWALYSNQTITALSMRDSGGKGWSLTLSKSTNNGDIRYNVSSSDSLSFSQFYQDTSIPTSWATITAIWKTDNTVELYFNGIKRNSWTIAETALPSLTLDADLIVGNGLQGQIRNIQIEHI